VRKQIEQKRSRNDKLKSELAAATIALAGGADAGMAAPAVAPIGAAVEPADSVRGEVQRGMSLYREKRYDEAAKAFEHVLALRPGHVMATNNLGFTYFKLGRLDDAVTWYKKAIDLDPKRAIAYANLGDALAQLGRADDAKRAYRTFLEMSPKAPAASSVQKKLAAMP
jgi:tetratricopeptide (TPR) repeat protein